MAFTGTKVWFCSSAKWNAAAAWSVATTFTVGQLVRQNATPTAGNERIFMCVVAGTSHATTEPTWVVTRGGKTTDNTVTWQEVTGIAAMNGDLVETPIWTAVKNTTVTLGHVITDVAGTHVFIADSASGTAGNGAEPTWNTAALGNTTVDNTVTWRYVGTSFGNWAAPHKLVNNMLTSTWGDTGFRYYVGSDDSESLASSFTLTQRGSTTTPSEMYSVSTAGGVNPPGNTDLTSGATITTTGASPIAIQGCLRVLKGFTFQAGTGAVVAGISFSKTSVSDSGEKYFEDCAFQMLGTSSSQMSNAFCRVRFKRCSFKFGATSHGINCGTVQIFEECSIDAAGTKPTSLFLGSTSGITICRGCDFSAFTSGTLVKPGLSNVGSNPVEYHFEDCKLAAGITLADLTTQTFDVTHVTFTRCSSAAGDIDFGLFTPYGNHLSDAGIARHLGAQNPAGVQFGVKFTTNANVSSVRPFESTKLGAYNSATGVTKTVTIYGIIDAAAIPTNEDVFARFQYLGAAGNPQATIVSTRPASPLVTPTNLTADTSDWDDVVAARQNTHAYVTGDRISLASNPGRVFFCTTGGTSNGTEPGGYATAVDGGSVTDGTATFRAGVRFKISFALSSPTPAQVGNIYAIIGTTKASSTFYIDPFLEIT